VAAQGVVGGNGRTVGGARWPTLGDDTEFTAKRPGKAARKKK